MRRSAVLLLAPVLVGGLLTGCGGGTSGASNVDKSLPTVTGHYGDKPKIKVAKGVKPSKKLVSTVLKKGSGPKVVKGDLLVADYLGSIYTTGKVFDNSYDRKAPSAFPIGVGKVVTGWDKTLVGVTVGSRVEMVLPPKDGYGTKGNTQAGIKGTDSLVFVVDVIARYGKDLKTGAAPTPVTTLPKDLPTVTGDLGRRAQDRSGQGHDTTQGPQGDRPRHRHRPGSDQGPPDRRAVHRCRLDGRVAEQDLGRGRSRRAWRWAWPARPPGPTRSTCSSARPSAAACC